MALLSMVTLNIPVTDWIYRSNQSKDSGGQCPMHLLARLWPWTWCQWFWPRIDQQWLQDHKYLWQLQCWLLACSSVAEFANTCHLQIPCVVLHSSWPLRCMVNCRHQHHEKLFAPPHLSELVNPLRIADRSPYNLMPCHVCKLWSSVRSSRLGSFEKIIHSASKYVGSKPVIDLQCIKRIHW